MHFSSIFVSSFFVSLNLSLQLKESLCLAFNSLIRGWESRSVFFLVCFIYLFFREGGGTFVDFVWIVVISTFFKSLLCLVNFSIYILDIFILSLRIQIFPVFQSIKGLYSLNHGNPNDLILLTSNLSRHFHPLISV